MLSINNGSAIGKILTRIWSATFFKNDRAKEMGLVCFNDKLHIFNHAAPKVFLPNIGSLKERNLNERGIIENICDNCFMCIHSQAPC